MSLETSTLLSAFSDRLNELLDARAFPAKGRGRQVELAKATGLSQKAVRKWLEGEGMPELTRLIDLATRFKCHVEWLASGRGPRDLEGASLEPLQRLMDRLSKADDATRQLVELALLESDKAASARLSPSLLAMVRGLKDAIAVQDAH